MAETATPHHEKLLRSKLLNINWSIARCFTLRRLGYASLTVTKRKRFFVEFKKPDTILRERSLAERRNPFRTREIKLKKLSVDTTGARMRPARLHDLRCTIGSILAELGAIMAVTKSLMGHGSMQTTRNYYTAISLEPARDSVSRHIDYMMQIAGS